MIRRHRWALWALGAAGLLAAGLAAACGGSSSPSAAPTQAATAATTAAATTPAGGGSGTITLIAKNTLFDKKELKAPAGSITFAIDNQDSGVVHNLQVFRGSDANGTSMGLTELVAGPVKQTLTLTLAAGTYFFQCDAHPATMAGKLVVQ